MHPKLDHLLRNRQDPQYKDYHDKSGELNLWLWLFDNGYDYQKGDDYGKIVIKGFKFKPEHQLDNVHLGSIILDNCSLADCDVSKASFEDAEFRKVNTRGANFTGTHFTNHVWKYLTVNDVDFSNAIFENCQLAYSTFNRCKLKGARFFDNEHSIDQQKADDQYYRVNFNDCDFDDAGFEGGMLLNHFSYNDCSMIGTKMRHNVFRAITFASNIDQAVFDHNVVRDPYNRDNFILLGPGKTKKARAIRNSVFTNNDFSVTHWVEDSVDGKNYLGNNTMVNNTMSCSDFVLAQGKKGNSSYSGASMQRLMKTANSPGKQVNNNYAPKRFLGFPCVNTEGGTESNLQRGGILALYLFVITLGLYGFYKVMTKCVLPSINKCRRGHQSDEEDELLSDEGVSDNEGAVSLSENPSRFLRGEGEQSDEEEKEGVLKVELDV